jgi:dTDP-4-amino-4,6-dideoxygalactose transaminase
LVRDATLWGRSRSRVPTSHTWSLILVLRQQLPAYSPITWRAIRAAFEAGAQHDRATAEVGADEIKRRFSCHTAVLTDSGTSALTLALSAVKAQVKGTRPLVAMPAYTCYDLATAALGAGVDVVLYDLDPSTLAPDEGSLRATLRRRPQAVVLVHLFGYPVDVASVRELVDPADVTVIEDAAQAIGASWSGEPAGSLGDVTVLSFGRGKGVTAGRGGALLQRSPARPVGWESLPRRSGVSQWADLAALCAQWLLGRPRLYWLPYSMPFLHLGETVFRAPNPPARASSFVPRILAVTMSLNEEETEWRRSTAQTLVSHLNEASDLQPIGVPGQASPSFLRLPFRCSRRTSLAAQGSGAVRLGIARAYPLALSDLPQMRPHCRNLGDGFPGACELAQTLFTMPTHKMVAEMDARRLVEWIHATGRQT